MVSHLLDTSVYSQRLRPIPLPSVVSRWKELGDSSLAISAIVEAEIRYGLAKKDSPRLWSEYREGLENRLILLPVDKEVANTYGTLRSTMEKTGTPRADFDLMVAATAIVHHLIVATCNFKHFAGIPSLQVEDWAI